MRSSPSLHAAPRRGRDLLFLALCLLIGAALRIDFLVASNFVVDADEAIVGLMGAHSAAGEALPPFYYGQHYMGSFEPYLVGLVFRMFGVSALGMKVVPLLFSLALIPLLYSIGREIGGLVVARFSALLMAVPPAALVVWSGKARGGFIELVFLGAYAFLLTVRWLRAGLPSLPLTAAIGFVLGFGWWTNNQIIFFMIPVAVAMAVRLLSDSSPGILGRVLETVRHGALGCAAFILGGLPFWLYNLQNSFVSFEMFRSAQKTDIAKHFDGFVQTSIPILLGAKHFWETSDIFPGSTAVAYSIYAVLLAALVSGYARDLLRLAILRIDRTRPVGMFVLFLFCTFSIFVVSSFGHLVQAPRYLLPAYVGVFVLSALALARIAQLSPVLSGIVLCSLLGFNAASSYAGGRAVPGEPIVYYWDRVAADHTELIRFLDAHDIRFVRTNYWIGYRLAFETQERVRFLVYREPRQTRLESYRVEAPAPKELVPLILTTTQAPLVEGGLGLMGIAYEKAIASGYTVLYHLAYTQEALDAVPPSAIEMSATQHSDEARLASDSNALTRWGTGEPQKPGMELVAELGEPVALRAITIDYEQWQTDFARGLQIEIEHPDGSRETLLTPDQYNALQYALDGRPELKLRFPPREAKRVILSQTGSDTFFDWSVGELTLYR